MFNNSASIFCVCRVQNRFIFPPSRLSAPWGPCLHLLLTSSYSCVRRRLWEGLGLSRGDMPTAPSPFCVGKGQPQAAATLVPSFHVCPFSPSVPSGMAQQGLGRGVDLSYRCTAVLGPLLPKGTEREVGVSAMRGQWV